MLGLGSVTTFLKYEQIAQQLLKDAEAAGAAGEAQAILARAQTAKADCEACIADFKTLIEGVQHPTQILGQASQIAAIQASALRLETEAVTLYKDLQGLATELGTDFDAVAKEVQPLLEKAK